MAPDDIATESFAGWLEQMGTTHFFIALTIQLGDDEITGLAKQKESIILGVTKNVGKAKDLWPPFAQNNRPILPMKRR